jgi:ribosomal-protein-alanine N-acetyltransferase
MNKQIDITGIALKTQRLILRPWKESDLEDFYEYAKVDGVGQMAGWLPHSSMEESKMILDRFIDGKKTFAIELAGKVIGSVGVEQYNEANFPELREKQGRAIGYVLSKDYWGRGIMPEAVQAVIQWLFKEAGLDFVLISHYEWNYQSKRVIQKCGGEPIKTTVHETRFGTRENTIDNIIWK